MATSHLKSKPRDTPFSKEQEPLDFTDPFLTCNFCLVSELSTKASIANGWEGMHAKNGSDESFLHQQVGGCRYQQRRQLSSPSPADMFNIRSEGYPEFNQYSSFPISSLFIMSLRIVRYS